METETYIDIQHNCPKDCPFIRKVKDKHVYLCTEYRVFLETDKYGLPRRNGQCGTQEVDKAKATLKSLIEQANKFSFDTLTREENELLNNIISILDASERETLSQLMNTPSTAQKFVQAFFKQPNDNELLANTRALIGEYDKKYGDEQKNKQSTQEKGKNPKSTEVKEQKPIEVPELKPIQSKGQEKIEIKEQKSLETKEEKSLGRTDKINKIKLIQEATKAKIILKSLAEKMEKDKLNTLSQDEKKLLDNLVRELDVTEQKRVSNVINITSLIERFGKPAKENDALTNIKELLKEYQKIQQDKQKQELHSRPDENKPLEATDQLRLRLLIEKSREKNGHNGL